jgi:hypothetical protein
MYNVFVDGIIYHYNSTFCPHSVFMCFVWIWEQTAIISLYNINWLIFITETECVYCTVRSGYLNIIAFNSGLYKHSTVYVLNLLQSTIQHEGTQKHSQLHVLCEKICCTGLHVCCNNAREAWRHVPTLRQTGPPIRSQYQLSLSRLQPPLTRAICTFLAATGAQPAAWWWLPVRTSWLTTWRFTALRQSAPGKNGRTIPNLTNLGRQTSNPSKTADIMF